MPKRLVNSRSHPGPPCTIAELIQRKVTRRRGRKLAQQWLARQALSEHRTLARLGPGADPQLVDAYRAELDRLGRQIDGTVFGEGPRPDGGEVEFETPPENLRYP